MSLCERYILVGEDVSGLGGEQEVRVVLYGQTCFLCLRNGNRQEKIQPTHLKKESDLLVLDFFFLNGVVCIKICILRFSVAN